MSTKIAKEKEAAVEQLIGRFPRPFRRRLRQQAGLSGRFADLVMVSPAAAFAIASQSAGPLRTGVAVRLVRQGAALKDVHAALALPMWLRWLPPEAFTEPLGRLPSGSAFNLQISNHLPRRPDGARAWLAFVKDAYRVGGEELAVWIAAAPEVHALSRFPYAPVLPLGAYAFLSTCGPCRARELIGRPWSRKMSLRLAAEETRAWLDRVAGLFRPPAKRRGPGRYSRRKSSGLRMVELISGGQLREEGRVMNHCAGSYVPLVVAGECRVFSIREHGKPVATMEVRFSGLRRREPFIVQLQGPGNTRVSEPIHRFAVEWLALLRGGDVADCELPEEYVIQRERWMAVFGPYLEAMAAAGPDAERGPAVDLSADLAPSPQTLVKLRNDADTLAVLAG